MVGILCSGALCAGCIVCWWVHCVVVGSLCGGFTVW